MDNVPVAWMWVDNEGFAGSPRTCYGDVPPGRITNAVPLYAAPSRAGLGGEWVRLMDSDWMNIVNAPSVIEPLMYLPMAHRHAAEDAVERAVKLTEARLKALNTPLPAPPAADAKGNTTEMNNGT